jgi:hypothetical protein
MWICRGGVLKSTRVTCCIKHENNLTLGICQHASRYACKHVLLQAAVSLTTTSHALLLLLLPLPLLLLVLLALVLAVACQLPAYLAPRLMS